MSLDQVDKDVELLLKINKKVARRAQRGRFGTRLLGEGVCHDNIVRIPWFFPNVVRNIRWPGGARLILKASQIGLYLIKVGLELDLMGKGDI